MPRARRPGRGRAIAVQHEVDHERIGCGIVTARCVIAGRRTQRPFRIDRAVGTWRRQDRFILAGLREK